MLLEEKIGSLVLKMAIPTIIAQLITTIYNLVDTYFVSTIGTSATAAVGVNSSLERTITVVGSLIGGGACSYIARLLGAGRKKDADRVLTTSVLTGFGIGILFAGVCTALLEPLVRLLGANDDCIVYAKDYAQYVLIAAPFMITSFALNMCLKSEGSATYAMIGIGFGGVLNCFLDPLFIRTLGLGVKGASMATAISKVISCAILLWPYLRKRTATSIAPRCFRFVAGDVKEVVSIGSTAFFRSALAVVSSVLINRVAGGYSTSALAAISVANRVMEFPFAIILGFGMGYQPVAGYNWGAGRYDRVHESLTFGTKLSVTGSLVMGALIFSLAGPIVRVFNTQADAAVLTLGILCIRLQCVALPIHAWTSVINMFYAGIGKAKYALLISTARQGYCFIPALFLLVWLVGADGIAATQALADVFCLFVTIPLGLKAVRIAKTGLDRRERKAAEAAAQGG